VAEHGEAKLERPVDGAAEQLVEALYRIKSESPSCLASEPLGPYSLKD